MDPSPDRFPIVRKDLTLDTVAAQGVNIREVIDEGAKIGYPNLINDMIDAYNRVQGMIANDMTKILQARMAGTMTNEEYAFQCTIYPDLPREPST
ncbi:MAG: hypothetical protein Greene041619_1077 [Candidatus Peregrinibacteria bacterium Greene0416_19]|nr:MAG: hypothetical protein Greene041619_1077 [Candidatus Peregrinibacteria bacterium Greene0416_19]